MRSLVEDDNHHLIGNIREDVSSQEAGLGSQCGSMSVVTTLLLSQDADLVETVNRSADSIPNCRLIVPKGSINVQEIVRQKKDVTLVILHLSAGGNENEVLAFLHEAAQVPTPLVTLVISDTYDSRQALRVLQAGAADYSARPIDRNRLAILVEVLTVRDRLGTSRRVSESNGDAPEISSKHDVGRLVNDPFLQCSPQMTRIMSQVAKVADGDAGILLTGETGTGKTHLARWIHSISPRSQRPFLTVNCASLSTSLIESELFGHVKGAFTGADRERSGKLAEAQDGTLFLDEIDALPHESQGKLLQTVDEKIYVEVGSNKSLPIQARLIAATNRSLSEEVKAGRFRADLHFRLNVIEFRLPPLRERRSEIRIMAKKFMELCAIRLRRDVPRIHSKALELIESYHWPGNHRELRNAIERGVNLCNDNIITINDLPENVLLANNKNTAVAASVSTRTERQNATTTSQKFDRPTRLSDVSNTSNTSKTYYSQCTLPQGLSRLAKVRLQAEVDLILEVLENQNNNRQQTARELGISRVALYKKLHKYGLFETREVSERNQTEI